MLCKKCLSGSEKGKKSKEVWWELLKIISLNNKYICRGTHQTVFATGPLVPRYATDEGQIILY